jgi:hypothetical protein
MAARSALLLLAAAKAAGTAFPPPLDSYHDPVGAGLFRVLSLRATHVPFNLAATAIFVLAITHSFLASRFRHLAHLVQAEHDAATRAAGGPPRPSVYAEFLEFFGEVEVVFGLWAVVLVGVITAFFDWETVKVYIDDTVDYTEALFVVVVMALSSTRPILVVAEGALRRFARLGGGTPGAWWLVILTAGPLLGSLITEPAAMTICALLLSRQFYVLRPSRRLAYATLGLLFVNVSIGGTLTHFAAPPVLMVARAWRWDTPLMIAEFGWKAIIAIAVSTVLYFVTFRRELGELARSRPEASPSDTAPPVPAWIIFVHAAFLAWTVLNSHYPALFVTGFLFFLGFAQATATWQDPVDLKAPLLVGFFLGGLVVHGGLQGWWIAPTLASLREVPLFLGATLLTAVNDNALITYLATLVPGLSDAMKHAVVAGAVTGGGLTVIANAPNPAGQAILSGHFEGGISPSGLLAGAAVPTVVAASVFLLLR